MILNRLSLNIQNEKITMEHLLIKKDSMRDPITKIIYNIDDRLLLKETWLNKPKIVRTLIQDLIENPIDNKNI